jgi:hypothetical protein
MRDERDTGDRNRPEQRTRKPYTKPVVREYGSIAKLTQSGGTTKAEPGGIMRGCL